MFVFRRSFDLVLDTLVGISRQSLSSSLHSVDICCSVFGRIFC